VTQLELAKKGTISDEMKLVAREEGVAPEFIQQGLAQGTIIIPANVSHKLDHYYGIGKGLRIKVNANIGTSSDFSDLETELEKLRVAIEYKADTVMDLSTGGDLTTIRRAILKESSIPLGTVPIYQVGIEAIEKRGAIVEMTADDLFQVIEQQARGGRGLHDGPLRRYSIGD